MTKKVQNKIYYLKKTNIALISTVQYGKHDFPYFVVAMYFYYITFLSELLRAFVLYCR